MWLSLNGRDFPAERWNDFAVVIVAAFANALAQLASGSITHRTVFFMDGPFQVDLTLVDENMVRMLAIERTATEGRTIEHAAGEAPLEEVEQQLLSLGEQLSHVARFAGDTPRDVQNLQRALVDLRTLSR
jgi:hypothetical protein